MERYAMLEDRYQQASSLIHQASQLLYDINDPEIPDLPKRLGRARQSLADAQGTLMHINVECVRLAVKFQDSPPR